MPLFYFNEYFPCSQRLAFLLRKNRKNSGRWRPVINSKPLKKLRMQFLGLPFLIPYNDSIKTIAEFLKFFGVVAFVVGLA